MRVQCKYIEAKSASPKPLTPKLELPLANHTIQADLESSNAQLSTGKKFPFLVIYALAPKVYFGHISLIIAASHMIQTHADRSIAGLHF